MPLHHLQLDLVRVKGKRPLGVDGVEQPVDGYGSAGCSAVLPEAIPRELEQERVREGLALVEQLKRGKYRNIGAVQRCELQFKLLGISS